MKAFSDDDPMWVSYDDMVAEYEALLDSPAAPKTFSEWLAEVTIEFAKSPLRNERLGQFLMNRAPAELFQFASQDSVLDCFYRDENVDAFLLFCDLAWGITSRQELLAARQMVAFDQARV